MEPTEVVPVMRPTPESEPEPQGNDRSRSAVSPSYVHQTAGGVQFQVNVNVDMSEFAGWSADRISAFFSGIAQVLAAKGALEKNGDH